MPFTKRSQEGYLLIDERACGGGMMECATITCSHCQKVVILNPNRSRARGYCRKCDHYVCDNPACNFECLPIAKVFDEARNALEHGVTVRNTLERLRKRHG